MLVCVSVCFMSIHIHTASWRINFILSSYVVVYWVFFLFSTFAFFSEREVNATSLLVLKAREKAFFFFFLMSELDLSVVTVLAL